SITSTVLGTSLIARSVRVAVTTIWSKSRGAPSGAATAAVDDRHRARETDSRLGRMGAREKWRSASWRARGRIARAGSLWREGQHGASPAGSVWTLRRRATGLTW